MTTTSPLASKGGGERKLNKRKVEERERRILLLLKGDLKALASKHRRPFLAKIYRNLAPKDTLIVVVEV